MPPLPNAVVLALLLALSLVAAAQAQEANPPEFVAVRVGFADRYKVGLWTPIEVTLRGGSSPAIGRVRASVSDSDGLNCSFDAPEPCQVLPGQETKVLLYVRFGHEDSTLSLELLDGQHDACRKDVRFHARRPQATNSPTRSAAGQRLIVSVGRSPSGLEKAVPGTQGQRTHGTSSRPSIAWPSCPRDGRATKALTSS